MPAVTKSGWRAIDYTPGRTPAMAVREGEGGASGGVVDKSIMEKAAKSQ